MQTATSRSVPGRLSMVLPKLRLEVLEFLARRGSAALVKAREDRPGTDGVDTLTCRSKRLKGLLSMTSDVFKILGQLAMEQYVARRIAAGVHLQVVRSREQEGGRTRWLSRPDELRELRWAPTGATFTMSMLTYDDKVSLISSRRENFGIIIQSEELSDLMSTLFALWHASRPA